MWRKVFLIGLIRLFFCNNTAIGQVAGLRILSPDSIPFRVYLDGFSNNDSSNVSFDFVFDSVADVAGILKLKLDSSEVSFNASLSSGFLEIYELSLVGNQYLVLPFLKTQLNVDSLHLDSVSPLKFNEELLNSVSFVPSVIGCSPPSQNFNQLMLQIAKETFSFKRIGLINKILKNNCLRVSQIRELLESIDYEDKRFELLNLAYQHTYDLNNFYQLKSLFLLEKYTKDFDAFLEDREDQ